MYSALILESRSLSSLKLLRRLRTSGSSGVGIAVRLFFSLMRASSTSISAFMVALTKLSCRPSAGESKQGGKTYLLSGPGAVDLAKPTGHYGCGSSELSAGGRVLARNDREVRGT